MHSSSAEEFPLLSALGLYAADIRGDGNCLFNALSDQIYGDQNQHAAIRARVIEYMREHAEYYKQFVDVHPGGGIRRNPKRKNAGAYSAPANYVPPSPADIDRVFDSHLQSMARGGTYGDNMEITAFAAAYETDVKIYQRDFAFMVTSNAGEDAESSARPVAHIAYHMWEHYSSIRNIDGPHAGLPEVQPRLLSPEEEAKQQERLQHAPQILPWQIDVVHKSLPFLADKPTIKRALESARGNIDTAVSNLLDAEEYGSTSSQQENSSVEREQDSDDDVHAGPSKKQDRRLSRATKSQTRATRHALSRVMDDDSQGSGDSGDSESSSFNSSSQQSSQTRPTSVEEDVTGSRNQTDDSCTVRIKQPVLIKLHPPKPPTEDASIQTPKRAASLRVSARDKKNIQKQAQKAARRQREQAAAKGVAPNSLVDAGLALRQKGMSETPPVETLRTLFI